MHKVDAGEDADVFAHHKRRAATVVRSIVVALGTLAIVLVCFWMYQAAQPDSGPTATAHGPQPTSSDPPDVEASEAVGGADGSPHGVPIEGGALLGPGKRVTLSIYGAKGRGGSRGEISCADWTPLAGSPDEVLLVKPEIRIRTNNGHAIRATADEALLEADRRGAGSVDIKRGQLRNNVVVEIDRLTKKERAQLPEELRDRIDPSQIVRIETDEILFDREYSKVILPGPVRLDACDAKVRAADVEIRFNEVAGRVEYCRFNTGGEFELYQADPALDITIPGMSTERKQQPVTEWIRSTLETMLAARQAPKEPGEPVVAESGVPVTVDGVPVFRGDDGSGVAEEPGRPIKYHARFQGDVDARQFAGQDQESRLQADRLEILRDFGNRDRRRMRAAAAGASEDPSSTPADHRVVVTWTTRLVMEAVSPEDQRNIAGVRSNVTAFGSPVHLSNPEVDVTCGRLAFRADESAVDLYGTESDPAVVRMADQGLLAGVEVHTKQTEDTFHIQATGPGVLVRRQAAADQEAPARVDLAKLSDSAIRFGRSLDVRGRIVNRTKIGLAQGISRHAVRLIDIARFEGQAGMREGETLLEADVLTLTFGSDAKGDFEQTVRRVEGRGDVLMIQGADRLTCQEMDLDLTTDEDGKPTPALAITRGDVSAVQGDRSIRARDELIVDFDLITRPARPFDAAKEYQTAVAAGLDATHIDWEARRREHEAKSMREPAVTRLRARGEVRIIDPAQSLDLVSKKVDCAVADGRRISRALVSGLENQPASVRLDTFTMTGREIRLDVENERVDVPGDGRMTFLSMKDLDGGKVDNPISVSVTWERWMKYRGERNEAVFSGNVHASSETATTFDCMELRVEFQDVEPESREDQPVVDSWIFQDMLDRLAEGEAEEGPTIAGESFSKQPAYILATGKAVALTSRFDRLSGKLKSRARIAGPKLSVDLRPDVSKMLIEGEGSLMLEDFHARADTDRGPESTRGDGGLFKIDQDAGPSKTLITWKDLMWYDFADDQARFEGQVKLKHLSGAELERRFDRDTTGTERANPGRATFLSSDVLIIDFLRRSERTGPDAGRREGGLSAERIRRFAAHGNVELQDSSEDLWLSALRVVYERDRNLLAIHGSKRRPARVFTPNRGEVRAEEIFYNTSSGTLEASGLIGRGR